MPTALALACALFFAPPSEGTEYSELVVTRDTRLTPADVLKKRIVVKADHITLDGGGLTLSGPGKPGDLASLEGAGVGVLVEGCTNVTIKNLEARGFAIGLRMKDCKAALVEHCDFSFNYSNPDFGWGEMPSRGGLILENVDLGVFRDNKATNVWDALSLTDCDDNLFLSNDFSHCTNTCAKLWESSRNKFLENDLGYGIRIDRDKGEVHARDSTSVLIESGSNDNYFYKNTITHGGDGVFIRPLNGWVSTGNVFVENDASYANNNCFESWSPDNVFIRNVAEHGSYGFWLGGSDHSTLIGNKANYSGLATGYHNAAEPGFGNAGIVLAGFGSSHTRIEGNETIGNNGAGIAFRGDVPSEGKRWSMFHWLIQANRIEGNQVGVWGRFGDWVTLAGNRFEKNVKDLDVESTPDLESLHATVSTGRAPIARFSGPSRIRVGESAQWDASSSSDPDGLPLSFTWRFGAERAQGATLQRIFDKPGFYRVGLNVSNGALFELEYKDLCVVDALDAELGTETDLSGWSGSQPGATEPDGGVLFARDEQSLVGKFALRITERPYRGEAVSSTLSAGPAGWDLGSKHALVFWMKARTPGMQGFQGPGPIVRLASKSGAVTLQPAQGANLFEWFNPFSEARYSWVRIEIPLAGSAAWERTSEGALDLGRVEKLTLTMDSFGFEPFTLWIDGLDFR